MARTAWATRIGYLALIVAIAGAAAMFAGATMVRYAGESDKLAGFGWVPLGMQIAAGGFLLAVVAIVWRLVSKSGKARPGILALLVAGVPLAWLAAQIVPASDVPAIHDVTTDLDNPPAFATLTLPEDNLRGVETVEKWRELHEGAYSDIAPLTVSAAPAQVVEAAAEMAAERGWQVHASEPAEGRMEATDVVSYYRFSDDVVIRATEADGGGTRVDMRSVSRVGISDLGYNAERIRTFLADLEGRLES